MSGRNCSVSSLTNPVRVMFFFRGKKEYFRALFRDSVPPCLYHIVLVIPEASGPSLFV